jgi:hypothetical protein
MCHVRACVCDAELSASGPTTMGSHTVQLSAEVVDVYQGTHCVIFLFDPKKEWTFTYIEREIEKVPKNVYILIVVRKKATQCFVSQS